jgi:hypothetical protein
MSGQSDGAWKHAKAGYRAMDYRMGIDASNGDGRIQL